LIGPVFIGPVFIGPVFIGTAFMAPACHLFWLRVTPFQGRPAGAAAHLAAGSVGGALLPRM
jgi:hypothetical protein